MALPPRFDSVGLGGPEHFPHTAAVGLGTTLWEPQSSCSEFPADCITLSAALLPVGRDRVFLTSQQSQKDCTGLAGKDNAETCVCVLWEEVTHNKTRSLAGVSP